MLPAPIFLSCRLALILIVLMSLVTGCGSSAANLPADVAVSTLPHRELFSRTGHAEGCLDECVPESIRFARGALGASSSKFQFDHSLEQVLLHLRDQDAILPGKAVLIPVQELLRDIAGFPPCSAILVHSSGHLWVVIGQVEIDGEKLVQLVHGHEPGMLVSKQEILEGGFREAWRIDLALPQISMDVGSGKLEIEAIVKNLGVVEAGVPATAVFTLKNAGHSPLRLVNAESSCSCTMSSLEENSQLDSGNSYDLAVTLHPNNSPSQRQQVELEIRNVDDETVVQQRLTIFASQRQALPVLPSTVDFGAVLAGGSSTRVVRVREVETIRFSLANVEVAALPLTHAISHDLDQRGLATYRITLELRPVSTVPGKHSGICTITTTSRTHPRVRVPVQYEILPTVTVEPQSLAVGTVEINQPHTGKLRIRSAVSKSLTVRILRHPPECSIEEHRDREGVELIVTTTLTRPGIWQDGIGIQVNTDSGVHDMTIRCTGLAR